MIVVNTSMFSKGNIQYITMICELNYTEYMFCLTITLQPRRLITDHSFQYSHMNEYIRALIRQCNIATRPQFSVGEVQLHIAGDFQCDDSQYKDNHMSDDNYVYVESCNDINPHMYNMKMSQVNEITCVNIIVRRNQRSFQ